jgi:hypothetical protein
MIQLFATVSFMVIASRQFNPLLGMDTQPKAAAARHGLRARQRQR